MVEKDRVDRLAHRIVAPEGEGDVAHPAADQRVRQALLDPPGRLDVVHGVVVVLLDPGGNGEDVGVEDDVLGREAHLLGEDPIGAPADLDLPLGGVGLSLLVERHHDHGGPVATHQRGLPDEGVLSLLEADRVDHAFPLHALESRLDDRPLGRVDDHGHPADVGLRGDELEEGRHRLLGVEHPLVHVDVQHLGAALDLLPGDLQPRVVVARQDQLGELPRAGHVGPLTRRSRRCSRGRWSAARVRLVGGGAAGQRGGGAVGRPRPPRSP